MKFVIMIFTFFLSIFMPVIISIPIHRRRYISNKTECKITYKKKYHRRVRDISKDLWSTWQFPIKYYVQYPVNKANVNKAIKIISDNTCVNFTESNSSFKNEQGLIFKEGSVCSSNVGLIDGNKSQEILLTAGCYNEVPYILHEIGHALGLIHEQSRRDRDKYVDIDLNNVKKDEHNNFKILYYDNYKNYSTSYDYYSLMHYHPKDFAINKSKVVITSSTLEPYNRMMGQRSKMTFNDFKQINLCYCDKCNWLDNNGKRNTNYSNVICKNGGYPDYNNCSRCICPTGYTGDDCNEIVASDAACGRTRFQAKSFVQNLFFDDNMTCYILLSAESGKRIKITIYFLNVLYKDICLEETSVQIKYGRDKGNTGLLLCGWYFYNIRLTSKSDSVLIIIRGSFRNNGIFLTFKEHTRKTKRSTIKRSKYKK